MPIVFDPSEYWQVRALEAELAVAQERVRTAQQVRDTWWQILGQKYEFDPRAPFVLKEDRSLEPADMPRKERA